MKFLFPLSGSKSIQPESEKGMTVDQVLQALDSLASSTASGISVTQMTAMQQSTVFACVRILSESIGMLPIMMKERQGGKLVDVKEHDALGLLLEPNGWQTPQDFWSFIVSNIELQGDGFAYKNRGAKGKVLELLPMQAKDTTVKQKEDFSLEYKNPVFGRNGLSQDQIFHTRNLSLDTIRGASTISLHKEAIGLAKQTEAHGAALFKNGAQLGRVFEHPEKLGDKAFEHLRDSLEKEYAGAANAHKTLILEEGMKVGNAAMTNEDAQFLETRRFQKQEIASIFGVPMFLLNDTEKSTTWGTGLEQLSRAFVAYTLRPRVTRLQQSLKRELLNRNERRRFEFKFDTDAFAMGDLANRFNAYSTGINSGILSPNEAREREGMNPREGGDEYFVSVQAQSGDGKTPEGGDQNDNQEA